MASDWQHSISAANRRPGAFATFEFRRRVCSSDCTDGIDRTPTLAAEVGLTLSWFSAIMPSPGYGGLATAPLSKSAIRPEQAELQLRIDTGVPISAQSYNSLAS